MAVRITRDVVPALLAAIQSLTTHEVLVGIPGDAGPRKKSGDPSNADLGFIHEFGAPGANIPARPFLRPGVSGARAQIAARLKRGALRALALPPDPEAGIKALHEAGLVAQRAVRGYINAGVNPPLSERTLKARLAGRGPKKGARAELARRDAGGAPGVDLAKPLVLTAQMRNSITYVVRRK